jgi:short-subunit dehydrogenase
MSFSGDVVVVTGAASGMGRLAAQRYAKAGKKVAGLDLNADGLKETADGLENLKTFQVDITSWDEVENVIEKVESEVGPIDRLVNCAGIMPLGILSSQSVPLIDKIMAVNYGGTVNSNKAVLPFMEERGKGEIINFASIAGWAPTISFGAYNAAKFAVVAWSEVLHHENKHTGIKVTCVCPPPVNTPLLNNAINVPKVLKSAPAYEPAFIIDNMEKAIAKNKMLCFPGFMNKISLFARRWMPGLVWKAVHVVEGKNFGKYLTQQS